MNAEKVLAIDALLDALKKIKNQPGNKTFNLLKTALSNAEKHGIEVDKLQHELSIIFTFQHMAHQKGKSKEVDEKIAKVYNRLKKEVSGLRKKRLALAGEIQQDRYKKNRKKPKVARRTRRG